MKKTGNIRSVGRCGRFIALAALFTLHLALFIALPATAQRYPERRVARAGDKLYNGGQFEAAETEYRRALEMQPSFPEATFNLGNALFRGEKGEEAARVYGEIAMDSLAAPAIRSAASYNLGNVMLAGQKLDEAIESYKAALRFNPTDMEAKFNLAYARKLKEQQQQQQQNQDQNQDGDGQQDQNQNQQNQDQNQDKNDAGQDKQNQDRGQDERQNDGNPEQDKPQQGDGQNDNKPQPQNPDGSGEAKIDPSTAEQMLEAVQGEEDKTREKVNAREVPAVGRSGKNW